jgi:hypothetical protein
LFENGFNFFSSLRKLFGRSSSTTNLALKTSNIGNDKGIYDEDAIGRKTYNIDANGFCLSSYTIDELENAEIIAQNKENYQPYSAQQTYAVKEPRNRAAVAAVYTKYKWWYWRHWGKQRYSFK